MRRGDGQHGGGAAVVGSSRASERPSWSPSAAGARIFSRSLGVGPIVAATVLRAWSHPGWVHSGAAFEMLAGVAPFRRTVARSPPGIDSIATATDNSTEHCTPWFRSGSSTNQAPATDYVARRTAEGRTSREIKRCLTRYVARDFYRLLESGASCLTNHRSVALIASHLRLQL